MRNLKGFTSSVIIAFLFLFMNSCSDSGKESRQTIRNIDAGNFKIGWSSADITPEESVLIRTQWVSEGVMDPVSATVLALESGSGSSSEKIIFISCDLAEIPDGGRYKSDDNLRDNIRRSITESIPIKNDKGEVIGESEMKNTHIATREDFEKGLELISEQADNLKSKIRKLDEQIKSFGKKPVMTGEMARIEKAMEGIMKLRQIKKLEADKSNQHEQLESLEKMRKRNSDALKNAPK